MKIRIQTNNNGDFYLKITDKNELYHFIELNIAEISELRNKIDKIILDDKKPLKEKNEWIYNKLS